MSRNVTKLPTLKVVADQQAMLAEGLTVMVERQTAMAVQLTEMMKHMGALAERQAVISAGIMEIRALLVEKSST